jgi:murein DD-endopeptidase MepM/ murein hydrolase activator NlpD
MASLNKQGMMLVAVLLLAACTNTIPAPVVQGKIQQNWHEGRRVSSPQVVPRTLTVQLPTAIAAESTPVFAGPQQADLQAEMSAQAKAIAPLPQVQEQNLNAIQPASGPLSAGMAKSPLHVPNAALTLPASPEVSYTVQATDTLFKIARVHDTTPQEIMRVNNLRNMADLEPGRRLVIPQNTKAPGPNLAASIAGYLSSPLPAAAPPTMASAPAAVPQEAALAEPNYTLNKIEPAAGPRTTPNHPSAARTSVKAQTYRVQSGETIFRISKRFGISVLDIMAANDLERPEALQAGMVLSLPPSPTAAEAKHEAKAAVREAKTNTPNLRPAAQLGVAEATRATMAASQTLTAERPPNDPDKGTDTAETLRPLQPTGPITEKDKLRAELKRGQIDRDAARQRGMIWPARGPIVKKFGEKGNGVAHTGINLAVPPNTPILATEDGTVLYADGGLRAYGQMVLLRHPGGMVSAYAHANHLLVRKGERVKKGQIIAVSGQTGNVETPQLHFELRRNATAIDPLTVLP